MNGELIGAPAPPGGHKKQRTYFRTITILANKPERSYLEITPRRVILDGGDRLVLPCNQSAEAGSRGLQVSVSANASVTVTIQGTVAFVVLIHLYKRPAAYQRDHLGFYIASSEGLSGSCHGLLGGRPRAGSERGGRVPGVRLPPPALGQRRGESPSRGLASASGSCRPRAVRGPARAWGPIRPEQPHRLWFPGAEPPPPPTSRGPCPRVPPGPGGQAGFPGT